MWLQEETTIVVNARDTQVFVLRGRRRRRRRGGNELNRECVKLRPGMIDRHKHPGEIAGDSLR